jgi:hypothetical protein
MNSSQDRPVTLEYVESALKHKREELALYVMECASRRAEMVKTGTMNEALAAMKGEISMAAMRGRLDIVSDLCTLYEEIAILDADLEVARLRDYRMRFAEPQDEP